MRHRLASLATLASCLATTLCAALPADAAGGFIEISLQRSGYVDLQLPQEFTLDLRRFAVPKASEYAGFFLQKSGERYTASGNNSAAFFVKGLAGPDDPHGSVTLAYGKQTLPPGRYRLNAIVDRPMTLTIPLSDDFTRRLTPSRPLNVQYDAGPMPASVIGQASADRPINVARSSTVISVVGAYSAAGATAQDLAACSITRDQAEATSACPNGSFSGVTTSTGLSYGVGVTATYGPGQLPPGSAVARGRVLAAGSLERIVSGALVFG